MPISEVAGVVVPPPPLYASLVRACGIQVCGVSFDQQKTLVPAVTYPFIAHMYICTLHMYMYVQTSPTFTVSCDLSTLLTEQLRKVLLCLLGIPDSKSPDLTSMAVLNCLFGGLCVLVNFQWGYLTALITTPTQLVHGNSYAQTHSWFCSKNCFCVEVTIASG